MDRTRRLSEEILRRHPESFGSDYEKNKEALEEMAIIPSKQLRNHIAGYIAKELKEEVEGEGQETDEEAAE